MITWKNKKYAVFVQESVLINNHATNNFSLISNAEKFLFYITSIQKLEQTYLILSDHHADQNSLYKKLTRTGIDCFLQNIHIDNINAAVNITFNRQNEDYWQNFLTNNNMIAEQTLLFVQDYTAALHAASLGMDVIVTSFKDETPNNISEHLQKFADKLKLSRDFAELIPQKITFMDFINAQTVT